jgi:hypothetical protein
LADSNQTFKLCFDGKKINTSISGEYGDIDLFGFEGTPTLQEKRERLKREQTMIKEAVDMLRKQMIKNINLLTRLSKSTKSEIVDVLRSVVHVLSNRLKELREAKLSKDTALIKFKKLAGEDWQKSRLIHVISAIETARFDIDVCITGTLELISKLGCALSCLCESTSLYITDKQSYLAMQANYVHLSESVNDDTDYRFIKQKTDAWFEVRKQAVVTGSTLNAAVGLESLKKQLEHFDMVAYGKEKPEFSEAVKVRLQHGVDNEPKAVATLVSKVLPMFYPDLIFYEEGCYKKDIKENKSIVVSPDGSCRDQFDRPIFAVEIKCPAPRSDISFKTRLHYSLPKYYVPQVLSEMYALNVDKLLYVCFTSESTTVQIVQFCQELWSCICSELDIYTCSPLKRPTRRSHNIAAIQTKIDKFVRENVSFLCEVQSVTGIECDIKPIGIFCFHPPRQPYKDSISIQFTQTLLHECEQRIGSAYNLTRTRASEFLGFMISDLDRQYREEEMHAVPIAYGLKGYSLPNSVMRDIMEYVLLECSKRGLYTPICSFDGQWYKMTVRDRSENPLTMLQLEKKVWEMVKKIPKNDLLKEMTSANLVKAADYEALSQQIIVDMTRNEKVNTLNGKLVPCNHFSVGKSRQGKVFSTSSNTRKLISKTMSKTTRLTADQESTTENDDVTESEKARRTNSIMSSLPTEFADNIEDDIINHIEEVSSSDLTLDNAGHVTSSGSDETDMNIEVFFPEDSDANLMEIRVLYDG